MPRLWVLLIFIWYYAVAIAKTETDDGSSKEDSQNEIILAEPVENLSESTLPFKEDIYNLKPEDRRLHFLNFHTWKNLYQIPSSKTRNKRSFSPKKETSNSKTDKPDKIKKREASNPNEPIDTYSSIENTNKEHSNKQNEDMRNVVDTASLQNLKYLFELVSKYRNLQNIYYDSSQGQDEKTIDPELLKKCLHPTDNKKSFSAWGGKRSFGYDEQTYRECLDSLMPQSSIIVPLVSRSPNHRIFRLPFKPWNGKREADDASGPKRLPFVAWGGKRDKLDDALSPKRVPFRAWGGKRNPEVIENPIYPTANEQFSLYCDTKRVHPKKTKFYSWGGKRNMDKRNVIFPQYGPASADILSNAFVPHDHLFKEAMVPWQLYRETSIDQNVESPEIRSAPHRRLKFNSWGGKRSDVQDDDSSIEDDKRTFSAWGGKRDHDLMELDLNDGNEMEEEKRKFSAWGGKRSIADDYQLLEDSDTIDYPNEYKRTFSAWGGK